MGALASIYFKKETLQQLLSQADKGIELTVEINDDTNQYGQNVSVAIAQTKEQREAKVKKTYVSNGKVFWTNGTIKKAEKGAEF